MENFKIPENPEYTEQIRKFKTTDKAHADLFNAVFQALINNEAFLKKVLEKQEIDTQEMFQQQYEQLTGYTDAKIGQLVGSAPETLDTIYEIAAAIAENETVIEALNEAVGKKLNKDGDLTDTTVTFTSEDTDESPTSWKDIGRIVSGKVKEILNRVSIISNNLKYLYKMFGTTDISGLADGTLTGAVSMLNTGIKDIEGIKYIDFGTYDYNTMSVDDCAKDIFNKIPRTMNYTYICSFILGASYRFIVQSNPSGLHASGILFSYQIHGVVFYRKAGGNIRRYDTNWIATEI